MARAISLDHHLANPLPPRLVLLSVCNKADHHSENPRPKTSLTPPLLARIIHASPAATARWHAHLNGLATPLHE